MALLVNLRHLDEHELRLSGELATEELDIDPHDEAIRLAGPVVYDLEAQQLEDGLLVQGSVQLPLDCQCVRCLKQFTRGLELPLWTCHVPLQGEEAAPVSNDCVDLTPYLREDILLEFPQHPLCEPECRGLPRQYFGQSGQTPGTGQPEPNSSAWNELNKLKL